ncbi:PREDICTED: centrosomal protein of 290 kDa-like [Acropora digitifera]|uniref:centrosomal protein of 290 kDa-like n=1 Tax=Acropora digitifera TaxID=70779 RepID=UPI00077B2352|nr:PREDICTED: centrosomal protein of 290 kDa-like [Acropora digitifera]
MQSLLDGKCSNTHHFVNPTKIYETCYSKLLKIRGKRDFLIHVLFPDLMANLQKVSQERNQLARERKKFKDELKMLDRGFFEEIEDLKYALQQAARLNSAYEKAVFQYLHNSYCYLQ